MTRILTEECETKDYLCRICSWRHETHLHTIRFSDGSHSSRSYTACAIHISMAMTSGARAVQLSPSAYEQESSRKTYSSFIYRLSNRIFIREWGSWRRRNVICLLSSSYGKWSRNKACGWCTTVNERMRLSLRCCRMFRRSSNQRNCSLKWTFLVFYIRIVHAHIKQYGDSRMTPLPLQRIVDGTLRGSVHNAVASTRRHSLHLPVPQGSHNCIRRWLADI
jgi:hypothetical protein